MKAAFEISTANPGIPLPETGLGMSNNLTTTATVLASIDPQVDVIFQMQKAFNNFIDSGQGWALLIGFFIGYLFRSLTAY
jgi:hypothetical protein